MQIMIVTFELFVLKPLHTMNYAYKKSRPGVDTKE